MISVSVEISNLRRFCLIESLEQKATRKLILRYLLFDNLNNITN